jgi:hypothetical protein
MGRKATKDKLKNNIKPIVNLGDHIPFTKANTNGLVRRLNASIPQRSRLLLFSSKRINLTEEWSD